VEEGEKEWGQAWKVRDVVCCLVDTEGMLEALARAVSCCGPD
jgi:hypothetical protein